YVALTAEVPTTPLLTEGQTLELGQTKEVCHEINTSGAKLIKQRVYRASPDNLEFLEKEIKKIEKCGII
ncbi:20728_t:CDS:2, partial [Racocetra persica]